MALVLVPASTSPHFALPTPSPTIPPPTPSTMAPTPISKPRQVVPQLPILPTLSGTKLSQIMLVPEPLDVPSKTPNSKPPSPPSNKSNFFLHFFLFSSIIVIDCNNYYLLWPQSLLSKMIFSLLACTKKSSNPKAIKCSSPKTVKLASTPLASTLPP